MSRLAIDVSESAEFITLRLTGSINSAEMSRVAFLVGDGHKSVELDMTDVDDISADGVATAVEFLRNQVTQEIDVSMIGVPQMLAHTLYKMGWLRGNRRLVLVSLQSEQPYGG